MASTLSLDGTYWRIRRNQGHGDRIAIAAFLGAMSILVAYFVLRLANFEWGLLAGVITAAVMVGVFFLGFTNGDPLELTIIPEGLRFTRSNGKVFTLRLDRRSTVRVIDQSDFVETPRWFGPYPPFVLLHSATTEKIPMTREGIEAVVAELLARGYALRRRRSVPLERGAVMTEYQN